MLQLKAVSGLIGVQRAPPDGDRDPIVKAIHTVAIPFPPVGAEAIPF
jgi:hypothetical protein